MRLAIEKEMLLFFGYCMSVAWSICTLFLANLPSITGQKQKFLTPVFSILCLANMLMLIKRVWNNNTQFGYEIYFTPINSRSNNNIPIITNQVRVWVKCLRKNLHICQSDSWPCMLLWSRSTNTAGCNQGVYSLLQQYECIIISGNYLLIWLLLQAADVFRLTNFQYCIVIYRMF